MKWAWRIGKIAGIELRVHMTFWALLAWIAWISYVSTGTAVGALEGVIMVVLVFSFVVLHELGHALTARHFGVETRDITLLPIGGLASLERMPEDPRQELLVALAGPGVNVLLAAVLAGVAVAIGEPLIVNPRVLAVPLITSLVWINLALGLFNLLPAFPMDGGRVLRALLALRLSNLRATRIAAGLGRAMALVFGIVGLFINPLLVFIALFLWVGASGEARLAEAGHLASGVPVAAAMICEFQIVSPEQPVAVPLRWVLETSQHDFPVVVEGRVVGMLGRDAMLRALSAMGPEISIGAIMRRDPKLLHPSDELDGALSQVMSEAEALPVVDERGRLVGVLTRESVGDLLLVREAFQHHRQRNARPADLAAARILELSVGDPAPKL